jgi:hypothetical protein
VITAQGEEMTSNSEQTETAPASVATKPRATKKARVGKRGANVAPKKATSAKKARKSEKKGGSAREGSKAAAILDLLKRPGGATSVLSQKFA